MARGAQSLFPEPVQASVRELAGSVETGKIPRSQLEAVFSLLSALPPGAVARADSELAFLARLYHRYPRRESHWRTLLPWFRKPTEQDVLLSTPGLEHIFIFHGDGRLREAALNRFGDGLRSPFFFAAIAWRLNDWAVPVRRAAQACAGRVFPKTDPAIIAAAAVVLLDRRQYWRRWGDEAAVLDTALSRPDVTDHLAGIICDAHSGPMAKLLRHALRRPEMDRHLTRLSTSAFLPAVRGVALQSLIDGRAAWPVGFKQQWIDRSLGKSRRVIVFGERDVVRPLSVEALIAQGARDRTATVRRVAAASLIRYQSSLSNVEEIIQQLANDRSKAVRERINFIVSQRSRQREADA